MIQAVQGFPGVKNRTIEELVYPAQSFEKKKSIR